MMSAMKINMDPSTPKLTEMVDVTERPASGKKQPAPKTEEVKPEEDPAEEARL